MTEVARELLDAPATALWTHVQNGDWKPALEIARGLAAEFPCGKVGSIIEQWVFKRFSVQWDEDFAGQVTAIWADARAKLEPGSEIERITAEIEAELEAEAENKRTLQIAEEVIARQLEREKNAKVAAPAPKLSERTAAAEIVAKLKLQPGAEPEQAEAEAEQTKEEPQPEQPEPEAEAEPEPDAEKAQTEEPEHEACGEEDRVEDDDNPAEDVRRRLWLVGSCLEYLEPEMQPKV
jgi:hypothetical protein